MDTEERICLGVSFTEHSSPQELKEDQGCAPGQKEVIDLWGDPDLVQDVGIGPNW